MKVLQSNEGTMLKLLGGAVFLWGVADIILNRVQEMDIYYELGIMVPEGIYPYTHYIAMGVGLLLINLGGRGSKE